MLSAKIKFILNLIAGIITLLFLDFVLHLDKIALIIFAILFASKSIYDYYQDRKNE